MAKKVKTPLAEALARARADGEIMGLELAFQFASDAAQKWSKTGVRLLKEGFPNQTALDRQATASEIMLKLSDQLAIMNALFTKRFGAQ